jgi:YVTN family beta-propeller protein
VAAAWVALIALLSVTAGLSTGSGPHAPAQLPAAAAAHASGLRASARASGAAPATAPAAWTGLGWIEATVGVGLEPYGVAYDPANGYVYVANRFNDTVSVLEQTTVVATVKVGSQPMGVVYDPADQLIYVSNYGSDSLSLISGKAVTGSLGGSPFNGPCLMAYDPADQEVYVPNVGGTGVVVINGTTVAGTVPTGQYPLAAVYDPLNQAVYVSNDASAANGGSSVTVVHGMTVVATITGRFSNPSGLAYDPRNGYVYVGNKNISAPGGSFVTVLDNLSIVGTVPVGPELWGLTYDPANGLVYASMNDVDEGAPTTHANGLAAIRGTAVVGYLPVGEEPYGSAYDAASGLLYAANGESGTVSVIAASGTNATPAPEAGTTLANVPLGGEPYGSAYDAANGWVYVANRLNDTVSVLNGTAVVGTVKVGQGPLGVVYDPADQLVYVANSLSDNLTVLVGTTVVGWVDDPSFTIPSLPVFDPQDSDVYVPDVGSTNVTVVSGTNVVTVLAAGTYPMAAAYDPANGYVYVTNDAKLSAGGSSVSVFSNVTPVATVTGGFANPSGIAYDPVNGYLYVGNKNLRNPGDGFVTVIDGLSAIASINVGPEVWGVSYDPANGYVYAAGNDVDQSSPSTYANTLAVLDGTSVSRYVHAGSEPYTAAFDPQGDLLYVTDGQSGNVSVLSTALSVGPATMAPAGTPGGSADVGQSFTVGATLLGVGTGGDHATIAWEPSGLLECTNGTLWGLQIGPTPLTASCQARAPGDGTLWANVSDGTDASVWSVLSLTIFAGPVATAPVASRRSLDVNQSVTFNETLASAGSGGDALAWTSSSALACSPSTTVGTSYRLACLASSPAASATANVTATDSNGESSTGTSAPLAVYGDPQVPAPRISPASAQVNETVVFQAGPTGGSGGYAYAWSGLPKGCAGSSANVTCQLTGPGLYRVSVTVTDSNGMTAISAASILNVTAPPSTGSTTTILGLNPSTFYGAIAGIVVAAFVLAIGYRMIKRPPKSSGGGPSQGSGR